MFGDVPVGVTVASDGALVFTDDGSNSVWRVTYTGKTFRELDLPVGTGFSLRGLVLATNTNPTG